MEFHGFEVEPNRDLREKPLNGCRVWGLGLGLQGLGPDSTNLHPKL